MSVRSTLARAAADLREQRVDLARERLHGLLTSHPTDLTVRRALAESYRSYYAQLSEVGRWNYLDKTLTTYQLAAFERRFPDPTRRLAVLRWPDPERNPPSTRLARRRLAALHREATGTAPTWPEHPEDAVAPAPPAREPAPRPAPPPPRPPLPAQPYRSPEPPPHAWAVRIGLLAFLAALAWLHWR
ncbi:DUF6584 family protein [Kitasatospora sp. NPDC004531]